MSGLTIIICSLFWWGKIITGGVDFFSPHLTTENWKKKQKKRNFRRMVPETSSRMSLNESAHAERETSGEVQEVRREVQQMIGDSKAFLLDDMSSMLVEFKRDNGWSEYGGAEGSVAEGENPAEPGPTDVGQSPAGAGPTAVRETILHDKGLGKFGETGSG